MSINYDLDNSRNLIFLLYVIFYDDVKDYIQKDGTFSADDCNNIMKKIKINPSRNITLAKIEEAIASGDLPTLTSEKKDIKKIKVDPILFFELMKDKTSLSYNSKNMVHEILAKAIKNSGLSSFENNPLSKENFDYYSNMDSLWELCKAILYVSGYKGYKVSVFNYYSVIRNKKMAEIYNSALDSIRIKKLRPLERKYGIDREIFKIEPREFIRWAKAHWIESPFFKEEGEKVIAINKSYITPEMQLMDDAVKTFWEDYNLNKPNPSIAPYKKDVVKWLKEEAKKRKINLSDSMAKTIDTIIRCPESRKGGNTK